MTTDRSATRAVGTRRRQDDLLDDLLATVPVPALPQRATVPAPVPPAPPVTPVFELRLTPLRWSLPIGIPVAGPAGVLLSFGPLQVFVGHRAG
jgi:hypothetical protein